MSGDGRTRVGAYAICLDASERILLCRLEPSVAPGETWTLPGGRLEFGEAPAAAVVRELAEESGYSGVVGDLLDVSDRLFTDGVASTDDGGDGRLHAIRIVYRVRIVGGALRDEIGGSTDTCGWFTLEEAGRLHLGELAQRAVRAAADLTHARSV